MKKFSYVLLVSIILILAGCSDDSDTSTGGDSADVTENGGAIITNEGGLLLVEVEDQATAGSTINLRYILRDAAGLDQPGTLFWNDNTSSRIRGTGSINHIYREPGTYRIAIQPDGGERVVVGSVVVVPAEDFMILVGDWEATFDVVDADPSVARPSFSIRINSDGSINLRNVQIFSSTNGVELISCDGRIISFELKQDGFSRLETDINMRCAAAWIAKYDNNTGRITGFALASAFLKPTDAYTARRR